MSLFSKRLFCEKTVNFKRTLKKLTNRSKAMTFIERVQKLNWVIRGWINYFALGSMKTAMGIAEDGNRKRPV